MGRYFWLRTLLAEIGKFELPKKSTIEPFLKPVMVYSVSLAWPLEWKMSQGLFNEHWTPCRENSAGRCLLSVLTISSYFRLHRTKISIMFNHFWGFHTARARNWTWINASLQRTLMITLVISIARGAPRCQHEQLTHYADWSPRLEWRYTENV